MKQSLNDVILHVRRSGRGRPLVLIHGVAGSGAIWRGMLPELEKHFDVIRLDLLGYGYSPKPKIDYTLDVHIGAIHRTINSLELAQRPIIAGLSMGALLAAEYAARYEGETSAVMCLGLPFYKSADDARQSLQASLWARLWLNRPRLARLIAPPVWRAGRNRYIYALASRLQSQDKLFYGGEAAREAMLVLPRAFSSTLHNCLVHYRLNDTLQRCASPILLVHGHRDRWTSLRDIEQLVSHTDRVTVVDIPDAPHNVAVFAPRQVAKIMARYATSLPDNG